METIVAAAIRFRLPKFFRHQVWQGEPVYPEHMTITAPPPARHGTLMHPTACTLGVTKGDDQGFLTSTGRYVGREEGLQIALDSGQRMIDHPSRHATLLFSEDLW